MKVSRIEYLNKIICLTVAFSAVLSRTTLPLGSISLNSSILVRGTCKTTESLCVTISPRDRYQTLNSISLPLNISNFNTSFCLLGAFSDNQKSVKMTTEEVTTEKPAQPPVETKQPPVETKQEATDGAKVVFIQSSTVLTLK